MRRTLAALTLLAACDETLQRTPEGCPIYYGPLLSVQTQACIAAYHAERARQEGRPVTRCYGTPGNMTCVTE
jgi:hypothetical protein